MPIQKPTRSTHDVFNQSAPYAGINAYLADPILSEVGRDMPQALRDGSLFHRQIRNDPPKLRNWRASPINPPRSSRPSIPAATGLMKWSFIRPITP